MNEATIVRELGGKRSGAGWMAKCPAHEDRNPSLSIIEKDGRLLIKCFAGCVQSDVISALKSRGLWPEAPRRDAPPRRIPPHAQNTATYKYIDENGPLLSKTTSTSS